MKYLSPSTQLIKAGWGLLRYVALIAAPPRGATMLAGKALLRGFDYRRF